MQGLTTSNCSSEWNGCFKNNSITDYVKVWVAIEKHLEKHNVLALSFKISNSGMSESFRRRSMSIKSNLWQCRRKCSLSSFAIPPEKKGLKQSKYTMTYHDIT